MTFLVIGITAALVIGGITLEFDMSRTERFTNLLPLAGICAGIIGHLIVSRISGSKEGGKR